MSELILLIGVPASGKSTIANEWVLAAKNRLVVDRDDLRMALFGEHNLGNKANEGLLRGLVHGITRNALAKGFDVMIADTNLYQKTREQFELIARETDSDYIEQWLDLDLATVIERHNKRVAETGKMEGQEGYLRGMFYEYLKQRNPKLSECELLGLYWTEKILAGYEDLT